MHSMQRSSGSIVLLLSVTSYLYGHLYIAVIIPGTFSVPKARVLPPPSPSPNDFSRLLFHLWILCFIQISSGFFFLLVLLFLSLSANVDFLALDFLVNSTTSTQTHALILYTSTSVYVCSENGTPYHRYFISITRAGDYADSYITTLRDTLQLIRFLF